MTDWADDWAKIFAEDLGPVSPETLHDLAWAIRNTWFNALEEAAKEAERQTIDTRLPEEIAAAIRALVRK